MPLSKSTLKLIKSLNQKKFRQKYNIFIAEGDKLCRDIFSSSMELYSVYSLEEWARKYSSILSERQCPLQIVSEAELKKISGLKTPNQVLTLVKIPERKVNKAFLRQGFHLYMDGIRDPGNMGTMIRIADWFGLDSLIASKDSVDFYNPKVVQASMGSVSKINLHTTDLSELFGQDTQDVRILGTGLEGENLFKYRFQEPTVIIIGNESHGIREPARRFCSEFISIPKNRSSKADSLNAAIAAGIICTQIHEQLTTLNHH